MVHAQARGTQTAGPALAQDKTRIAAVAPSGVKYAFTLPYCAYTSTNNPAMPRVIGDCLRRAGLLGSPEYWPDVASKYGCKPGEWVGAFTFSINDRDPQLDLFEKAVKKGLEGVAANKFECGPHLVLGIHTWQKDDKGFGRFGEIITMTEKRPEWWYCNENEYVAYRMQLFHNTDNRGEAEEQQGAQAVPGVRLALGASVEKNVLSCVLKNESGADFKDVRLTFRVPPKWKTGVVAKDLAALKAGAEQRYEVDLGERNVEPAYDKGPLYFAVQCDLIDGTGAARVYGTTEVAAQAASK